MAQQDGAGIMAEQQTYLIAGLGNPGPIYARTRHNVGFMCLERLAARHNLRFDTRRLKAEIARGTIDGHSVMLAKPQTYMNDSGISIAEILHWYKIPQPNLLVIYDELDLPAGLLRLRERGSGGGHNGVKSIIAHLGQDFNRLRVGIGRPSTSGPTRDYVLNNFTRQEAPIIAEAIDLAAEAAEVWLRDGIIVAMNRYNGGISDNPPVKSDKPPNKPDKPAKQELPPSYWEHWIWSSVVLMVPISFIIAELLMYTLLAICLHDAWKRGFGWVAFIVAGSAFGVLLEYADILTNKGYTYGNFMVMVGPVPICIGIGWGVIMYSVRLFTDSLGLPIWTRPFLDALLAVNIDLSMDVVAYRLGMWKWDWSGTGRSPLNSDWFGIPWANFYGWMMVVLTFSSLVRWLEGIGQRRSWGNRWQIAAPFVTLILAEPLLLLGITWPSWAANALSGIIKPSNTWWLITWTLGLICLIVAAYGLRHRQPVAHPPLPTWIVPLFAHTYFPLWLFLGGFWLQDGWLVVAAATNALLCLAIHLGGVRLSRRALA